MGCLPCLAWWAALHLSRHRIVLSCRNVLAIVQVVIEAGANGGVQGGTISVSNSTNGQGTQCASGINVQPGNGAASQAAVVACSAWGRYLTITASAKMNLCR